MDLGLTLNGQHSSIWRRHVGGSPPLYGGRGQRYQQEAPGRRAGNEGWEDAADAQRLARVAGRLDRLDRDNQELRCANVGRRAMRRRRRVAGPLAEITSVAWYERRMIFEESVILAQVAVLKRIPSRSFR
ncbi:hypothetical protein PHYPSEUDO_014710 [Phytophthora pseudosyringae]|uniref:Uncharacterized protein n=1 Tax=Phytophthora pseudosyringae TaxID=221518 RepID=A0A8T1W1E4_9STRA|nr:hypothetical protein PHYPSEUDO_014710 [Phytophthora pseudosyringae]